MRSAGNNIKRLKKSIIFRMVRMPKIQLYISSKAGESVRVKLPAGKSETEYLPCYTDNSGTLALVPVSAVIDGYVTFLAPKTEHIASPPTRPPSVTPLTIGPQMRSPSAQRVSSSRASAADALPPMRP